MSEENVEIVRRGYQLFQAGDLEGVAALLLSGYRTPRPPGGLESGTQFRALGPDQKGFVHTTEETRDAFEDFRRGARGLHRRR